MLSVELLIDSIDFQKTNIASFMKSSSLTLNNCTIGDSRIVRVNVPKQAVIRMNDCKVYFSDYIIPILFENAANVTLYVSNSSFIGGNSKWKHYLMKSVSSSVRRITFVNSNITNLVFRIKGYLRRASLPTDGEIIFKKSFVNNTDWVMGKQNFKLQFTFQDCLFFNGSRLILSYMEGFLIDGTTLDETSIQLSFVSYVKFVDVTYANMNKKRLEISSSKRIRISDTTFTNTKQLYISNTTDVEIVNTSFTNTSSTIGGAIYSSSNTILIENCLFSGNNALVCGDAIYSTGSSMTIRNTNLTSSVARNAYSGNLLYSNSDLTFENVSINASAAISTTSAVIMFAGGEYHRFKLRSNYLLQCPTNTNLEHRYNTGSFFTSTNILLYCVPCKKGSYSLQAGRHYMRAGNLRYQHVKCIKCPLGGMCDETGLRSKDNYWGYVQGNKHVDFIICPAYYCCSSTGSRKCLSYNTCARNRNGVLCGSCRKGFSENIASTTCVSNTHCTEEVTIIFAVTYAILPAVLTIVLMYLKEICVFVKRSIFNASNKQEDISLLQPLIDDQAIMTYVDGSIDSIQNTDIGNNIIGNLEDNVLYDYTLVSESNSEEYSNESSKVFAVVRMLTFFFQVASLIRICSFEKNQFTLSSLNFTIIVSTIFNLKLTGEYDGFIICPIKHLTIVGKEILKMTFIFIIFGIIIVLHVMMYCYSRFTNLRMSDVSRVDSDTSQQHVDDKDIYPKLSVPTYVNRPFNVRLRCFLLRMIMLSYLPISVFMFKLLACHKINNTSILYIQGDIECYNTWQKLILAAIVFWVAPFCGTLYLASCLLENNKVSSSQFMNMLIFPPSTMFYYVRIWHSKTISRPMEDRMTCKHIVIDLYQSFRRKDSDNKLLMWQSVLILRKLLLVVAYTFIQHPVAKLYTLLFLLISFLILHNRVKPYNKHVLNEIESCSLAVLIFIGILNTYWAVGYVSDISTSTYFRSIGNTVIYMELGLLLSPAFVLLGYGVVRICKKLIKCCKSSSSKQD